jgi:hypothetical protein
MQSVAERKPKKPTSLREVVAASNGKVRVIERPEEEGTVRLTMRPGRRK